MRLRGEDGMTLVEVLAATLVLAVGVIGSFGAFDGSRKLGAVGEKKQIAARYAESELEHMRSMGWADLQLTAAPTPFSDTRGIATSTSYAPPQGVAQPLRIASSCPSEDSCVTPGPDAWTLGNASGLVYRFVTTDDDTACGSACSASVDRLRLTVVVTVNAPNAPLAAIVASTIVIDPSAQPAGSLSTSNPVASTGGNSIGASTGTTYYLSDTPVGGTYGAPCSDHPLHDTVAAATGVPDQLRTASPTTPTCGAGALRAYSNDFNPAVTGGAGLAASSSCAGAAKDTAHVWATPVLNSSAAVTATGNAAITLPTSTLGGATVGARLCVAVYEIGLDGSNHVNSSQALGAYAYELPSWPTSADIVAFGFRYLGGSSTRSIAAGHRLAVRLTADVAVSSGITLLYDHPAYPASVQLETQ